MVHLEDVLLHFIKHSTTALVSPLPRFYMRYLNPTALEASSDLANRYLHMEEHQRGRETERDRERQRERERDRERERERVLREHNIGLCDLCLEINVGYIT